MSYDPRRVHAYASELASLPGLAATPAVLEAVAKIKRSMEQADRRARMGNPLAIPGTGRQPKPCKKSLRRNRCWKRHRAHRWHAMAEG